MSIKEQQLKEELDRLKYNTDYKIGSLETTISNLVQEKEDLEQEKELYKTWYRAKHDDLKNYLGQMSKQIKELKMRLGELTSDVNVENCEHRTFNGEYVACRYYEDCKCEDPDFINCMFRENIRLKQQIKDLLEKNTNLKKEVKDIGTLFLHRSESLNKAIEKIRTKDIILTPKEIEKLWNCYPTLVSNKSLNNIVIRSIANAIGYQVLVQSQFDYLEQKDTWEDITDYESW